MIISEVMSSRKKIKEGDVRERWVGGRTKQRLRGHGARWQALENFWWVLIR